jgi:uncharacterized membrane protein
MPATTLGTTTETKQPNADLPMIVRVRGDAHWGWLRRGWVDFMAGWKASLYAGLAVFFISVGLVSFLWNVGYGPLVPVAIGAFIIGGPALAVSVYGVSARLEKGEIIVGPRQLFAKMASPGQVAFIGFGLFIIVFVWARLAFLLYALFSGQTTLHSGMEALQWMLGTLEGLSMMLLGSAFGACLALLAFASAMISVPMVANRRIDAMTAMVLSVVALQRNPMACIGWAFVIVMLMGISVALFLIPLAFVFPWLGHATWHAYREMVQDKPAMS